MQVVILITTPNRKEAKLIAEQLIKNKLAACVNVLDGVESLFWWQGKVDSAKEVLLMVKTKKGKLESIIKKVKSLHSYQVPEVIALPIVGGFRPYLRWIDDSLR
ncbi:MAG: divalent-cation tolerance protein CutA [Candidatus Omnitrophota bacterium]